MACPRLFSTMLCLAFAPALVAGCSGGGNDGDGFDLPPIPAGDSSTGYPSHDTSDHDDPDDGVGGKEAPTTTDDPPETSATTDDGGGTSTTDGGSTGSPSEFEDTADSGGDEGVCVGLDPLGFVNTVFSRSGGNVGGACSATPGGCGGDPVGQWTAQNNCGEENSPNIWAAFCPGATRTVNQADTLGTMTFAQKGTFSQTTSSVRQETITVDVESCWGGTCDDFRDSLNAQAAVSASCGGSDDSCACDLTTITTTDVSGVYDFVGDGELLLTVGDDAALVSYCVGANRMDLWTGQLQPTWTSATCVDEADCTEELGEAHPAYACATEGTPG